MLNWTEVETSVPKSESPEQIEYIIECNADFLIKNIGKKFEYKGYQIKIGGIPEDFHVEVDGNRIFSWCYDNLERNGGWNEKLVRELFQ